eukprot:326372-Rhodomonas_salina.2
MAMLLQQAEYEERHLEDIPGRVLLPSYAHATKSPRGTDWLGTKEEEYKVLVLSVGMLILGMEAWLDRIQYRLVPVTMRIGLCKIGAQSEYCS